jgi:hypothetical protein
VGGDCCYELPATEEDTCEAVQRDATQQSLRYGTVALYFYSAHPQRVEQLRCAAGWLHSLSSHRPCDTFCARAPLHLVLSRKNTSRKKDLYGKTKKSTHGHQNLIRSRTHNPGMPVDRPRRRRRRRPQLLGGGALQGTCFLLSRVLDNRLPGYLGIPFQGTCGFGPPYLQRYSAYRIGPYSAVTAGASSISLLCRPACGRLRRSPTAGFSNFCGGFLGRCRPYSHRA